MVIETLLDLLPRIEQLGPSEACRFSDGYRVRTLTYRELQQSIAGFARFLAGRGFEPGARLVIWGENRPEWMIVFWAALARGLQVVPLDARSTARFVTRIHEQTDPCLLLYGETVDASSLAVEKIPLTEVNRWSTSDPVPLVPVSADDVVEIVFTSGTTGEPKGVVHRHRNICSNLQPFAHEIERFQLWSRPFQPIRILDLLPLSHLFGQSLGLFIPLLLGGAVVFTLELSPESLVRTVKENRVSVIVSVPRLLGQLRDFLRTRFRPDLSTVRLKGWPGVIERWWRFRRIHSRLGWKFWAFVVGGAPVPLELERFFSDLGFLVVQGYGLTEASPIVAVNHPFGTRIGSMGKPLKGQQVRIAEDGEILVRGESVVTEFLGGDVEEPPVESGWLHTGDIGEIDEQGRLYYRGRKKEVIVTSEGANVFPQDVEAALKQVAGVRDAVAVGRTRERGEEVHAVLILNRDTDAGQIVREANRLLEPHQKIQSWSIWPEDEFPLTLSTLKVRRSEVARRLAGGERAEGERPDALAALIARLVHGDEDVSDQMRLDEDLGLTSLDRIELLSRIDEQMSVGLDETSITQVQTVGELKSLLSRPTASRPAVVFSPPRWARRAPVGLLRRGLQRLVILPLYRHYVPETVTGLEILESVSPPVIFSANHASHLDTVAVLSALPRDWRRWLAPAMAQEHFQACFSPAGFKWKERIGAAMQYLLACALFNAYPLPQRMGGVREFLRYSGELVEHGFCPLVYPEGERTPDGRLLPFQAGIGLMSVRLRVPVVPLYLEGLFEIYSLHHDWFEPGKVRVTFGTPLEFSKDTDYREAARQIEAATRALAASS